MITATQNRNIKSIIPTPHLPHIMGIPHGPPSWPLAMTGWFQAVIPPRKIPLCLDHRRAPHTTSLRYGWLPSPDTSRRSSLGPYGADGASVTFSTLRQSPSWPTIRTVSPAAMGSRALADQKVEW